jgi:hypothetical protein
MVTGAITVVITNIAEVLGTGRPRAEAMIAE